MADITFTKLRTGDWGLRVTGRGDVAPGDTVAVTKRSGQTELKTVGRVIWRGDGVVLCSIANGGGTPRRQQSRQQSRRCDDTRCRECGGYNPYGDPCAEPCD